MLGIIIFIYALLSYLGSYMKDATVQLHFMRDDPQSKFRAQPSAAENADEEYI